MILIGLTRLLALQQTVGQRCIPLAVSLALLGVPLGALKWQQHVEVGELSRWADEMISSDRAEQ